MTRFLFIAVLASVIDAHCAACKRNVNNTPSPHKRDTNSLLPVNGTIVSGGNGQNVATPLPGNVTISGGARNTTVNGTASLP